VASRVHKRLVTALIVVASLVGTVAVFAVWLDRQALNTDEWTSTSGKLLENSKVRSALAHYLVDQIYPSAGVSRELGQLLPAQARPLASPASDGLKLLATRAVQEALGTAPVQYLWRQANRVAHRELLAVINGGVGPVSTSNGTVSLDLGKLVRQLGGPASVGGLSLAPGAAKIEILHSHELQTAQGIAHAIRDLALLLTVLGVALYASAVALARGWRRVALRDVGLGAIAAGVAALIARGLIGQYVVNQLSQDPTVRPAAGAVWSIGSSLLSQTAIFLVIDGLLIVAAAALAGPSRIAYTIRGLGAHYLYGRAGITYAIAAAVFLLLVVWGPTLAFRTPVSVAVIAALVVVGTEALRRQVRAEFPGARSTPQVGVRRRLARAHRTVGHGLRRAQAALETRAPRRESRGRNGRLASADVEMLRQLGDLRERGALTDEEFAAQKALILAAP
jgi:hypothetical protein